MRNAVLIVCVAMVFSGCKVGPNYARPPVPAPPQFRAADSQATEASLGDKKWAEIFQDQVLQKLIQEALDQNYDLKIAAQRVLAAQGQLTAIRSALFPQGDIGAVGAQQRSSGSGISLANVIGSVSWEIDLFGKIRRSSESANADVLAQRDAQEAVRQILVSQVAAAYFQLRELDLELSFLRESLKTRQESVQLVEARVQGGVASELDADQSRTLVSQASASISNVEKGMQQTENLLSFLVGRTPGPIDRGGLLSAQYRPPVVPAGLPSSLLERRPDVRQAEQQLVAANARVGVAKAAFFPSIALTGGGGYQTFSLTNVTSRVGGLYSYGATVDIPIFDMGRRKGNYATSQAEREAAVQGYLKALMSSFQEVSDALIGYQKSREYRGHIETLTTTLTDQSRLADMRYRGGVSSYLEVLDTERDRLNAEQDFAKAQLGELLSLVQLYKALGGGWQP
jgi:outer membrane protein, multidrug efflux system